MVPASRSARSRRSSTRTTSRSSGRTTTRPTSSSSTTSARPGGAAKLGLIDKDHPLIAALPPAGARRRTGTEVAATASGLSLGPARAVRASGPSPTPDGIVDLSVGTPVDPTPEVVRDALADASDAPGYPQTWGTPALREAVAAWFARRRGVPGVDPDGVLPTIGSKELVAWLPTLLGLGAGDVVVHPRGGLPDLRGGRAPRRARPPCRSLGTHGAGPDDRPGTSEAGLGQLPRQPDRPGAAGRAPAQDGRPGPGSTARSWPVTSATPSSTGRGRGARLGPEHPRPAGLRGQPRGPARGLLAVQAVQPRRLPRRLRRRRPGAGRAAARDPQARRHDGARAGAGGDGGRARRRRARGASSGSATAGAAPCCATALEGAGFRSTTPRPASTSGRPAERTAGTTVAGLADRGILVAPGSFYGAAGPGTSGSR